MEKRVKRTAIRGLTCLLMVTAVTGLYSGRAAAASGPCVYNNDKIISTWRNLANYPSMVIVIAHRGWWGSHPGTSNSCGANVSASWTGMPENSWYGVLAGLSTGFEAAEVDIKMTKDGIPILMHDFTLGRTTNIYQVEGGKKFDPYGGTGVNPRVDQTNWFGTIERTKLLTPDRKTVSDEAVPAFAQLLDYYKEGGSNGILVLDVKDRASMKAVWQLMNNHVDHRGSLARNWVAVKFNMTTYPNPADLEADLYTWADPHGKPGKYEPFLGLPVITNNMLDKMKNLLDVEQSYMHKDYTLGVEVNLNQPDGRLQKAYTAVGDDRYAVGIFNPIADPGASAGTGENMAFFKNTGQCCYRLNTVRYGDSRVDRWDWSFLYGLGYKRFDFITTDEPGKMLDDLQKKNLRNGNYLMQ